MTYEYLVTWQRQGLGKARQFFQTEKGARTKAERLMWLDVEKKQTYTEEAPGVGSYDWENPNRDMPDLIEPPTIQRRSVGAWEAA